MIISVFLYSQDVVENETIKLDKLFILSLVYDIIKVNIDINSTYCFLIFWKLHLIRASWHLRAPQRPSTLPGFLT